MCRRAEDVLTIEEFYSFNVVIVTLTSAARFVQTKVHKYFDFIFVDEAGYATEPEVLIPITGFGMTFNEMKSSVVLFGGNIFIR